jgi:hypothetical protein
VLVKELACSFCSRARDEVLCSMFGVCASVYWALSGPE